MIRPGPPVGPFVFSSEYCLGLSAAHGELIAQQCQRLSYLICLGRSHFRRAAMPLTTWVPCDERRHLAGPPERQLAALVAVPNPGLTGQLHQCGNQHLVGLQD